MSNLIANAKRKERGKLNSVEEAWQANLNNLSCFSHWQHVNSVSQCNILFNLPEYLNYV